MEGSFSYLIDEPAKLIHIEFGTGATELELLMFVNGLRLTPSWDQDLQVLIDLRGWNQTFDEQTRRLATAISGILCGESGTAVVACTPSQAVFASLLNPSDECGYPFDIFQCPIEALDYLTEVRTGEDFDEIRQRYDDRDFPTSRYSLFN